MKEIKITFNEHDQPKAVFLGDGYFTLLDLRRLNLELKRAFRLYLRDIRLNKAESLDINVDKAETKVEKPKCQMKISL